MICTINWFSFILALPVLPTIPHAKKKAKSNHNQLSFAKNGPLRYVNSRARANKVHSQSRPFPRRREATIISGRRLGVTFHLSGTEQPTTEQAVLES